MQPYLVEFEVGALTPLPSWMEPRLICLYHADTARAAIDGAREHIEAMFQPEVGADNPITLTVAVVGAVGEPAVEPFVLLATPMAYGTFKRDLLRTWGGPGSDALSLEDFLAREDRA